MNFKRQGLGTAAVAGVVIVVALVVGVGVYVTTSGGTKTSTVTSTSTATVSGSGSTVTSVSTSVSVSTSTASGSGMAQPTLPTTLPATTSPISEAGSSLVYPYFQLIAANFTKLFPNVQFNTAAGGSGAGQSGVEQNTINIGGSDPFLTNAQMSANPGILNIAVAVSAQQVNYNLPGVPATTHLNFTGSVIAGIYNGTITYWDDPAIAGLQSASVASSLPHQLIVPLHRSDSSGDTNLFTTYLSDTSSSWLKNVGSGNTVSWPSVPTAQAENGNAGMLTGCSQTQYSIAYIGVSYLAQATTKGLGSAALKNLAGNFVQLTTANVQSAVNAQYTSTPPDERLSMIYGPGANSYPIVNYEYALVKQHQSSTQLAQDIQAILVYTTLPQYGQSNYFMSQTGFIPLPASIAQLSWAQIESITSP